jgi:hypothetical protein
MIRIFQATGWLLIHDCGSGGGFVGSFAAENASGDESNDKAEGQGLHEGAGHVNEAVLVELLRAPYASDPRGGVGGVKSGGLTLSICAAK